MNLNIAFPNNMVAGDLVRQERIPCMCKVAEDFEIHFSEIIPDTVGVVTGWDRRELEIRAPAGAGGEYTHYSFGMITIKEISLGIYKILELEMFNRSFGWCHVISGGEYAAPGSFWDEE